MTVLHMDCVMGMRGFPTASFDSIVCDPPYELGFMGKSWDSTGIANSVEMWKEAFRVLKPGGHLLAFSGTRTQHRMICAIEDAGFEIRDQIGWVYGSGFPKSLDVSKAIDKAAGAEREIIGTVTKLDAGFQRVSGDGKEQPEFYRTHEIPITAPATDAARQWQGWGTALKPAWEPICVARKPLAAGTVAANVLAFGTGALNIDACRIDSGADYHELRVTQGGKAGGGFDVGSSDGTRATTFEPAAGRWPANIIHDGSDDVLDAFQPDRRSGSPERRVTDQSPARFFYCAKASKADRDGGNNHPTVKPTELMRYLVRLVTPTGGVVLDPFSGSGSTGKAAILEGFHFIGFEQDEHYAAIANARIDAARR